MFENDRTGRRGNLAQVVAALLQDDEARSPAGLTQAEFGKLREPMLRLVQWARTFGVTSASGAWKITDLSDPGSRSGTKPFARTVGLQLSFAPVMCHPARTLAPAQWRQSFNW